MNLELCGAIQLVSWGFIFFSYMYEPPFENCFFPQLFYSGWENIFVSSEGSSRATSPSTATTVGI